MKDEARYDGIQHPRAAGFLVLTAVAALSAAPATSRAQAPSMDRRAVPLLQRMTTYLGGLEEFSVDTQNTLADILASGREIQYDIAAVATVQRPNKLRAERKGGLIDQAWYYDGKTLDLYDATGSGGKDRRRR